jgi:ribosomal protein L17
MRHSYNKLKKLHGTSQKSNNIVRNLITSLIISGQIVTTPRKAKILVSSFDKFVSKLVSLKNKYESEQDVKREAIRIVKSVVYSEDA